MQRQKSHPSSKADNPRVYFDIEIDKRPVGRIQFELFKNVVPLTAENFRQLCTGEKGKSQTSGKQLHFKNSIFHRIIPNFMAQGGDFTRFNGTGGESIYGTKFKDENFKLQHSQPFLLSMANAGRHTNGSQFFITFTATPHLNGKHVVFGWVEKGHDIIKKMEGIATDRDDKPRQRISIAKCGQLIKKSELVKKAFAKEQMVQGSKEAGKNDDGSQKKTDTSNSDGKKDNKESNEHQNDAAAANTPEKHQVESGSDDSSDDEDDDKKQDKEVLRKLLLQEKLKEIQDSKLKPKENPGTISKSKKKRIKLLKKQMAKN